VDLPVDAHRRLIRSALPADDGALSVLVADHDRRWWRFRHAAGSGGTMLVGEVDGEVCGVLSIRWDRGCDAPHPWLYGGAVLPALRGRGLGTALWLEAHELCVARGASHASLDVDVANVDARRPYERMGYVVQGPHEHDWVARDEFGEITGRGSADTWLMRAALSTA
jgi:ribosomal protein S18 acetylase RimI-like enzyme